MSTIQGTEVKRKAAYHISVSWRSSAANGRTCTAAADPLPHCSSGGAAAPEGNGGRHRTAHRRRPSRPPTTTQRHLSAYLPQRSLTSDFAVRDTSRLPPIRRRRLHFAVRSPHSSPVFRLGGSQKDTADHVSGSPQAVLRISMNSALGQCILSASNDGPFDDVGRASKSLSLSYVVSLKFFGSRCRPIR